MGNNLVTTASIDAANNVTNSTSSQAQIQHQTTTVPLPGCPMHAKSAEYSQTQTTQTGLTPSKVLSNECPMQNKKLDISECPMHKSTDINPLNQMPPANQMPSPGQPFPLSTDRVKSNIPKADTSETWTYPSEQMFWNAMLRKGWRWQDDQVRQHDMTNIVRIHNANNEKAWHEVLKWEAFHCDECKTPKLKKFGGKATEFSPRARIRHWMGYELPFDRHDWIVDRCGKEVRYIIDYYDGGKLEANGEFTLLDVRPALDSFEAFTDRCRAAWLRWTASEE